MRTRSARLGLAAAAFLLLAFTAAAQVPTALLVEDGPVPGLPGETADSISNSAVNHAGGWAFTVNTSDGSTTTSRAFGAATLGPGSVLFSEGTFGDFQQTSWESFFGLSDAGQVAYSPSSENLATGDTGIDGVWLDAAPVLNELDPIPTLPGLFSSFNSRPGVTADGTPYWVGGSTSSAGGRTQGRVLFYGFGATPVLKAGDSVGLPEPIDTGSDIDFDFRFSALGTHVIAPVNVTGSSTADGVVTVDATALVVDGGVVREGSPVPASVGALPGENWDNFDFMGITESGTIFFTGDTDVSSNADEFVFQDGAFVLREGTAVPSALGLLTLSGSIEGGYQNEDGDYAVIWDVNAPAGNVEALIFNGEVRLLEGDPVDLDGDGAIDAGTRLSNFTGITALTLSDCVGGVHAYFTADVDTEGTSSTSDDVEGAFRLLLDPDSDGDGVCDARDACPDGVGSATIVIDGCDTGLPNPADESGCTVGDRVLACAEGARNHGAFVSCVAHLAKELADEGLIDINEKGHLVSCAAQSDLP